MSEIAHRVIDAMLAGPGRLVERGGWHPRDGVVQAVLDHRGATAAAFHKAASMGEIPAQG